MGTHPIFESDFDCLTVPRNCEYDMNLEMNSKSENEENPKILPVGEKATEDEVPLNPILRGMLNTEMQLPRKRSIDNASNGDADRGNDGDGDKDVSAKKKAKKDKDVRRNIRKIKEDHELDQDTINARKRE